MNRRFTALILTAVAVIGLMTGILIALRIRDASTLQTIEMPTSDTTIRRYISQTETAKAWTDTPSPTPTTLGTLAQ